MYVYIAHAQREALGSKRRERFKTICPHAVREEGVVDGRAPEAASCIGHKAGVNRKEDVGLADGLDACMDRCSEAVEGIGMLLVCRLYALAVLLL